MKSWTLGRARAWLFGLLFLMTFLFVRVYHDTPVFFVAIPADDSGYLAYTESILKGSNFDWCHPAITDSLLHGQCKANYKTEGRAHAYNMYSPGPAIALLPITALGNLVQQVGLFTPDNVNPLVFWSIVGTFLLFAIGTFFLFECCVYWLRDIRQAWWITLFFAVGNPLVYFVMRRPLMSHAAEYFLFFGAMYFLVRTLKSPRRIFSALVLGAFAGLMMITRFNNVHVPAFIGILLLFWPGPDWARNRFSKVAGYIAGTLPFIFLFLWINYLQKGTFLYSTQNYYEAYTIGFFLKLYAVNPLRVLQWFFGPHWGLVWLMPLYIYEFYYLFTVRKRLFILIEKSHWLPLSLIAVVLTLHLNMMANGPSAMSYAYRYVFTYYFFIHIGFLIAAGRFGLPLGESTLTGFSRRLQVFFFAAMVIGSAHILNYESRVPSLRPGLQPAHTEGIHHPYWRDTTIWTTPNFAMHSFVQMLKGTPLVTLAGSPAAALPILLVADTPLVKIPGMHLAVEYYRSKNREVYSVRDLLLTYQYEFFFGVMAALAFFITRRVRKL